MLESIKNIHFIGIGGIGMSALAKLMKAQGKEVSGSDLVLSEITRDCERFGIRILSGHSSENIKEELDAVVYSVAVQDNNVERVKVKELGIQQFSYAEFLGETTKQFSTIVVTGTHGKSTTTALLGLMFEEAGYDPTVLVGSLVPSFELGNLRIGKGRFFVVEGCEYKATILKLHPEMIVLTNIEEDHLDFYRDIDHIRDTFQEFVNKLIGKGMCVWNRDDDESRKIVFSRGVSCSGDDVTDHDADYSAEGRVTLTGKQTFEVYRNKMKEKLGQIELQIPGKFNVSNALMACAAAMELGVPFETCAHVLKNYKGIWRRYERLGQWHGAEVISDYGHHPTAITKTIKATREFFPNQRILLCYQPHQHSRTKELFDEFVVALREADVLVLPEIYEVTGRTEVHDVSSRDIAERVEGAYFAEDFKKAESILRDVVKEDDVLIIMGAGDIDELARRITS
ncbi:MAG: UDP-N-acetylmuramate--L-alanine ligase [Patescibacteria group bacterium]